jgi:pimeloyl-ACP methyl ester carboxylesterase
MSGPHLPILRLASFPRFAGFSRLLRLSLPPLLGVFAALGPPSASARPGNPPGTQAAQAAASPVAASGFAPALHVRIGPDSNACGISVPGPDASGTGRIRKRPLIVWLHGGMGGRDPEKGFESHRALTPFVGPSDYYLCSPSAFLGQEWTRPQGIAHVDALIDYMASRYPVDAKDITLAGVSDGCLGVIAYSVGGKREIRRRVLISSAPQLVLPLESLAGQSGFAKGTWDFFQGGRDRLFPSEKVIPYLRQWEKLYPNARLHYYPEGEHDFSFYAEHAAHALRTVFLPEKTKGN